MDNDHDDEDDDDDEEEEEEEDMYGNSEDGEAILGALGTVITITF